MGGGRDAPAWAACGPGPVATSSVSAIAQPPSGGPLRMLVQLWVGPLPASGPGATQLLGRVEPARRRPAGSSSLATRAAVRCCTTRRLNAHRTTERTLLYPWHPWSGLSVRVHEVTERGGATALRCSLAGDAGRCLEVPAWMFEREACVPLAVASRPRVGVG